MADDTATFTNLTVGDPFPHFTQRCQGITFAPDAMAGRYLVFCFYGSAADPRGRAAVEAALARRNRFDDERASFFGMSVDPEDERSGRVRDAMPGVRFMWDFDRSAARKLGAAPRGEGEGFRQFWLVVGPSLRVMAAIPFAPDGSDVEAVFELLDRQPHPSRFAGFEVPAPVLVIPNVFDRELCQHLIDLYDRQGGNESGVMRNNTGVFDRSFKSRKDYTVEDTGLITRIQGLISRRVLPDIERLFFMKITRMERYIVGCYAAEDRGFFMPHRDNNPGVTQHRRYAVSINLNADFEGGAVSFPEYNPRGLKAPAGWAVVFPCAALHAVSRVTSGRRYAFLPFVYDEGGAALRQDYLQKAQAAEAAAEPAVATVMPSVVAVTPAVVAAE